MNSNLQIFGVKMSLNNSPAEYVFEKYEEYYGEPKEVSKQITLCKICGAKLIFSHNADFQNLVMQESARCPDCGSVTCKHIHSLN